MQFQLPLFVSVAISLYFRRYLTILIADGRVANLSNSKCRRAGLRRFPDRTKTFNSVEEKGTDSDISDKSTDITLVKEIHLRCRTSKTTLQDKMTRARGNRLCGTKQMNTNGTMAYQKSRSLARLNVFSDFNRGESIK